MQAFMSPEKYMKSRVTAKVVIDNQPSQLATDVANRTVAAFGYPKKNEDLAYLKFVLASEMENYNSDYLPRSEIVANFGTARNKPFDIEHVIEEEGSYITDKEFNQTKNTIIGHIVDSAVAQKDGTVLAEESLATFDDKDDPSRPYEDQIDIVGTGVLYKFLFPQTVADIIDLADKGEMSVSMEVWFLGYDYLVGTEIVPYSETTAAQYQPMFENREEVDGRPVSRVLRNVIFGGVAATDNPADPEAQILETAASKKELAGDSKFRSLVARHNELHELYVLKPSRKIETEHLKITKAIASMRRS